MRKPRTRKSARRSTKRTPARASRTPGAPPPVPAAQGFPVVGLGASAGGLEAFEQFFRHVPVDGGLAFVLVSHLDPSHESILTEIIQRTTSLPVVEVTDGMAVRPNGIYVIPPNRDLALTRGVLRLRVPEAPRGRRMPIDDFFCSLAEDRGEAAVGVVLSGTGSDGTLGLRAILGSGGVTIAQDPATARYDGMPTSAIRSGYASQVLPPERMPEVIRALTRAAGGHGPRAKVTPLARGLGAILAVLRARTGHDFSHYKKSTILRRVERRMVQHDITTPEIYTRYLKEHPAEVQLLFKEMLINVTGFFRDPEAFEALRTEVLPRLVAGKPDGWVLRAWVAGCASGEEAYSIAILLHELAEERQLAIKVQIYATDLDEDAIATARAGIYPALIAEDVRPDRLRRHFVKEEGGYRVKKEIREMVVFAVQNVIKDPAFTRLDLLACRNLLIYLEPELQDRLLSTFHYALRPGGVLFLAPSESLGRAAESFRVIDRKWKLFEVVQSASPVPAALAFAPSPSSVPATIAGAVHGTRTEVVDVADLTGRALLKAFAPAAVVTDRAGSIVYVHGDAGKYLQPAPGKATLNVVDMGRGGLGAALRKAFRSLAAGGETPSSAVPARIDGKARTVLLGVAPLGPQKDETGLLLVTFQEPPIPAGTAAGARGTRSRAADHRRVKELEAALAESEALLRATVEEQQASTDELKSINEELQSTNEEFQSTNEELETSKEELQSVNEELVTVNSELQAKIDQLASVQSDMRNLLDNVSGGVVFLDSRLVVRRFTRDATKVFRLVATDVGRPLRDIKSEVDGDGLLAGAGVVLETLVPWERELPAANGGCYLARVQPYRTLDNVIDGVVMTFTDITSRVAAEAAVQEARRVAQGIVDAVREPLVVLDEEGKVCSASRAFYERFRVRPDETVGRSLYELGDRQWDVPELREALEAVLVDARPFDDLVVERDFPRIGPARVVLNGRRILGRSDKDRQVLLAIEGTSEAKAPSGNG